MNKQLQVYLFEHHIGDLRLNNGEMTFQYSPQWLAEKSAIPLSLSLPLQEASFSDKQARPFFNNLLPEAEIRSLLVKSLGISKTNDFALLEAIGGECAGAVSLLRPEDKKISGGGYKKLNDAALDTICNTLYRSPFLIGEQDVRLSLAGAQTKLPVYMQQDTVSLPLGNYPSSHIIKPSHQHFAQLIENEYFCMQLAAACGLNVPQAVIRKKPQLLYVIQRYDRPSQNNHVVRLHQEDFCQALGKHSSQKYQREGGPNLVDCFALLQRASTQLALDRKALLEWVCFNYFIGNADAHAKNLSLLLLPRGPQLAPFYDLICTSVYPELSKRLAMKIGGENRLDWIAEHHWQRFAQAVGIKESLLFSTLARLAPQLEVATNEIKEQMLSLALSVDLVDKIMVSLHQRTRKFL